MILYLVFLLVLVLFLHVDDDNDDVYNFGVKKNSCTWCGNVAVYCCGNVNIHDKRRSKTEQISVPLSLIKKLKNKAFDNAKVICYYSSIICAHGLKLNNLGQRL